jgi:hypothetical protein
MRRRGRKETFEAFEKRLHGQLQEVERELLSEDLVLAIGSPDGPLRIVSARASRRKKDPVICCVLGEPDPPTYRRPQSSRGPGVPCFAEPPSCDWM